MKSTRLQFAYRKSASKLHRAVGDWLRGNYANNKVYQEYPVVRVNPTWPDGRARYDWVLLDLGIVIECMGRQHYEETSFGPRISLSTDRPGLTLKQTQEQDRLKKEAAEQAGFLYVTVRYDESPDVLAERLLAPHPPNQLPREEVAAPQKSEYHLRQLEKARTYRKEQYQRRKQWLKNRSSS